MPMARAFALCPARLRGSTPTRASGFQLWTLAQIFQAFPTSSPPWPSSGRNRTRPWGPRLALLTDVSVLDVDECAVTDRCLGGQCVNTDGSFNCVCETGFQPSPESGECVGKGSAPRRQTDRHLHPASSSAPWGQEPQLRAPSIDKSSNG